MKTNDINHPVILFDGECNLCNSSAQLVIKLDTKSKFRFASLQSKFGRALLKSYKFPSPKMDSFLLLKDGKLFEKSTAVLMVVQEFGFIGKALSILKLIPVCIRDFFYSYIAQNRYRWFGKSSSCILPTTLLVNRFLK